MRNKISLLAVLLIICLTSISAQQKIRTTDFATFKKWSSQVQMSGYKQGEVEDESSINFTANYFAGTTKLIQIGVSDISYFKTMVSPAQKAQQYLFDGKNAVYYASPENSFLAVEYKQQEFCVSVAATGKVDKAFLEAIFTKSNPKALYNLTTTSSNSSVKWPLSIPESLKLPAVINIEKLDPDGYYAEIYELKAKLSNELIEKLKALMAKYNTTSLSELIKDGKAQLICSEAETIEQLKSQFKQGESVKFIIYIK